jgi:hypothetical protein
MLTAAVSADAQPRRALSGDLTKPIADYTGDEFFALVNGLNYTGGQLRARRCSGMAGCATTQRTNVRVDGVADVDSVTAGNLPQFGVVAARAVVQGNANEATYGMLSAGPAGRYSYYLIVERGAAAGAMTWRLEEMNVQGNTRTHRTLRTGRFAPCVPAHPFQRGGRADFRTCTQTAAAPATRVFVAAFLAQGSGEPPLWIGCGAGCCTADY